MMRHNAAAPIIHLHSKLHTGLLFSLNQHSDNPKQTLELEDDISAIFCVFDVVRNQIGLLRA